MKPSELVRIWEHFLLGNSSRFAFVETHDVSGDILRGPISGMLIKAETLTIRTHWTARRPKDSDPNQWQNFPDRIFYYLLGEYASAPQEQECGRVYFRSSFQDNYLYPANHSLVQGFKRP